MQTFSFSVCFALFCSVFLGGMDKLLLPMDADIKALGTKQDFIFVHPTAA